ncbi:MAG: ArsO family NAD(P)H-dependent flavin-containing monooxygenase [Flammeovirgaceae bacterium]
MSVYDCLIIGGGQSGLAVAYYLRRSKINYRILDEQSQAGGAWIHVWDSLKLFSPAEHSSLPGWLMPKGVEAYPSKAEVIDYLQHYEQRYQFPIQRNTEVYRVKKEAQLFVVYTSKGVLKSKTIVSATGTWKKPYIPSYPNQALFEGKHVHSAQYTNPGDFVDEAILLVGGGNSGAQILAELSQTNPVTWITLDPPKFLPDDVDGRYLFEYATKLYQAKKAGLPPPPKASLGDIVMVETVKEARSRGVLVSQPPFTAFTATGVRWDDGRELAVDTVIWCTGFKSALTHLTPLQVINSQGRVATEGTKATAIDGLWLVGYGGWTGFASATLIGVGRSARQTAKEVTDFLKSLETV